MAPRVAALAAVLGLLVPLVAACAPPARTAKDDVRLLAPPPHTRI